MVLKHKTVLEFTISSGKQFHLLIVLTQNEFILNVFKALGFFSFFELPHVWVSENSNSPFMEMSSFLCTILKSNRNAMNRNWSNQKANPALKTKAGNK